MLDTPTALRIEPDWLPGSFAGPAVHALDAWADWRDYTHSSRNSDRTAAHVSEGASPATAWWGLEWSFLEGKNELIVSHSDPMPQPIRDVVNLAASTFSIIPNQVQVNRYEDEQGLIWHSDLDSRGWLATRTITVGLGAPRELAVAIRPDDWGERLRTLLGADPRTVDLPGQVRLELTDRDATIIERAGHDELIHAVLPGPGRRYSINVREYRLL